MKSRSARIPLPAPVFQLARLFAEHGYALCAVGGHVRDWLMQEEFYAEKPHLFSSKDVDLATDAHPQEVGRMLTQNKIRNFEKGESFGVWVAHVDRMDFEIATFREDIGSSDGRHPDEVRYVTAAEDYKRRDLTFNALYYQIPADPESHGTVIDYGTGFEDLAAKRVRCVGNPMDRFAEDKLRVLRCIRFFCRYNNLPVYRLRSRKPLRRSRWVVG